MASSERFGYKWSRYPRIIPEHGVQFRRWIAPWTPADFRGRSILDAGCGIGANSFWALKGGAKEVAAFDLDPRTVEAAAINLSFFPNAKVFQRSIFDIDCKKEFDIAMAIGVIHHLEDPLAGVKKLAVSVKPGGKVLIWVYGYEGNEWIVRYISPIRRFITSRLSVSLLHILTYAVSVPFYLLLKIAPLTHPYFLQLRQFRFSHVHSIIFDQLLPRISHYYRRDEAEKLLTDAGLADIVVNHCNKNSWTVIGTKR